MEVFKEISFDDPNGTLGDSKNAYVESLRSVAWLFFIVLRRIKPNIANKLLQNANAMLASIFFVMSHSSQSCDLRFSISRDSESKGHVLIPLADRQLPGADVKLLESLCSLLGCKLNETLQEEIAQITESLDEVLKQAGIEDADAFKYIGDPDRVVILQTGLSELYVRHTTSEELDEKLFVGINQVDRNLTKGLDTSQIHPIHKKLDDQP